MIVKTTYLTTEGSASKKVYRSYKFAIILYFYSIKNIYRKTFHYYNMNFYFYYLGTIGTKQLYYMFTIQKVLQFYVISNSSNFD